MSKSDQKKTKPFNINERVLQMTALYDDNVPSSMEQEPGTDNVIVSNGQITTEKQLKKDLSDQDKYKILKQVANQKEKKQFRDIERKYKNELPFKKNKLSEQRRLTKQTKHEPQVPMNFDFSIPIRPRVKKEPDQTLAKLQRESERVDPDLFKGLGSFFGKKF